MLICDDRLDTEGTGKVELMSTLFALPTRACLCFGFVVGAGDVLRMRVVECVAAGRRQVACFRFLQAPREKRGATGDTCRQLSRGRKEER